jgi:hypothetical protein
LKTLSVYRPFHGKWSISAAAQYGANWIGEILPELFKERNEEDIAEENSLLPSHNGF